MSPARREKPRQRKEKKRPTRPLPEPTLNLFKKINTCTRHRPARNTAVVWSERLKRPPALVPDPPPPRAITPRPKGRGRLNRRSPCVWGRARNAPHSRRGSPVSLVPRLHHPVPIRASAFRNFPRNFSLAVSRPRSLLARLSLSEVSGVCLLRGWARQCRDRKEIRQRIPKLCVLNMRSTHLDEIKNKKRPNLHTPSMQTPGTSTQTLAVRMKAVWSRIHANPQNVDPNSGCWCARADARGVNLHFLLCLAKWRISTCTTGG